MKIGDIQLKNRVQPCDGDLRRLCRRASQRGLLYIHDIEGVTQQTRDVPDEMSFAELRRRFGGTYIANNQYTLELATEALANGEADLFSFGGLFLANPDLVERLRTGAPLAEAPKGYWYGGGSVGYSDWPAMTGPNVG